MNELQKVMYNKYIKGKISLKELLQWNESYQKRLKEREVKAC